MRPDLGRLRDLVNGAELDLLYVSAADRLASGGRLMLLYEKIQEHGVQVIFLKGEVDGSPERKLLLHMQGAMVGGHAPYGYTFIRRSDTSRARLEIDELRAPVVQMMYRKVIEERLSTRGLAQRLTREGIPTSRGAFQ